MYLKQTFRHFKLQTKLYNTRSQLPLIKQPLYEPQWQVVLHTPPQGFPALLFWVRPVQVSAVSVARSCFLLCTCFPRSFVPALGLPAWVLTLPLNRLLYLFFLFLLLPASKSHSCVMKSIANTSSVVLHLDDYLDIFLCFFYCKRKKKIELLFFRILPSPSPKCGTRREKICPLR